MLSQFLIVIPTVPLTSLNALHQLLYLMFWWQQPWVRAILSEGFWSYRGCVPRVSASLDLYGSPSWSCAMKHNDLAHGWLPTHWSRMFYRASYQNCLVWCVKDLSFPGWLAKIAPRYFTSPVGLLSLVPVSLIKLNSPKAKICNRETIPASPSCYSICDGREMGCLTLFMGGWFVDVQHWRTSCKHLELPAPKANSSFQLWDRSKGSVLSILEQEITGEWPR